MAPRKLDAGPGMVAGFLIWLLVLSLVAMASSAYVKWRVVAAAVSLAFFFILGGIAGMIDEVLRVTWGHIIDPAWTVNRVWCALLGVEAPRGPGAAASAAALVALVVLLVVVIERKLRPVEVVRDPRSEASAIVFDEVSKFYGEVLGVNRVTLNIPPGITSLVGPNGSGKTTLMNLMTGLILPTTVRSSSAGSRRAIPKR